MKNNYFLSAIMTVALCITLLTISCKKDGSEQIEDLSKYKKSEYSSYQYMEKDNGVVRYWIGLSTAKLNNDGIFSS